MTETAVSTRPHVDVTLEGHLLMAERWVDYALALDADARPVACGPAARTRLAHLPDLAAWIGPADRALLASDLVSGGRAGMALTVHEADGPRRATARATRLSSGHYLVVLTDLGPATEVQPAGGAEFHDHHGGSPVPALLHQDGVILAANAALGDLVGVRAGALVGKHLSLLLDDQPPPPLPGAQWMREVVSKRPRWVRPFESAFPGGGRLLQLQDLSDVVDRQQQITTLNAQLHARVDELAATQDRLAAMFRKVSQTREDERRDLAVRLHDETVQHLVVASWFLDDLATGQNEDEIAAVRRQLDESMNSVRAAINDLRPAALDHLGLVDALTDRARHILGDSAELDVRASVVEPVEPSARILVLRTLVECLRNVRRHADASHVRLEVATSGGHVQARLLDDGVGFDPQRAAMRERAGHLGLVSVREEIALAGGQFDIAARRDGKPGTEVSLSLPPLLAATA